MYSKKTSQLASNIGRSTTLHTNTTALHMILKGCCYLLMRCNNTTEQHRNCHMNKGCAEIYTLIEILYNMCQKNNTQKLSLFIRCTLHTHLLLKHYQSQQICKSTHQAAESPGKKAGGCTTSRECPEKTWSFITVTARSSSSCLVKTFRLIECKSTNKAAETAVNKVSGHHS